MQAPSQVKLRATGFRVLVAALHLSDKPLLHPIRSSNAALHLSDKPLLHSIHSSYCSTPFCCQVFLCTQYTAAGHFPDKPLFALQVCLCSNCSTALLRFNYLFAHYTQ